MRDAPRPPRARSTGCASATWRTRRASRSPCSTSCSGRAARSTPAWWPTVGVRAPSGYPHDPALAALADPAVALAALGLPRRPPWRAWRGCRGARAALRAGDAVVKVYASDHDVDAAVRAMRHVGEAVPTAPLRAFDRARRLVAQGRHRRAPARPRRRRIPRCRRRRAGAPAAGRGHHRRPAGGGPRRAAGPGGRAGGAGRVRPPGPGRATRPPWWHTSAPPDPPSSGSSPPTATTTSGQLLDTGEGLAVVDLDTLCAAPVGFDLAAYATNVISGRGRRRRPRHAGAARGGARPWGCRRRARLVRGRHRCCAGSTGAVRRLKRDWPERTDALVGAVEAAARRG